jgi:hypothetical protein
MSIAVRIGATNSVAFGAPQRDVRRYAVVKRAGQHPQALFEILPNEMHVPLTVTQQPFLVDVLAQLPDDDLATEADWSASQGLDSLGTAASIVHSLPIGPHDDPFDVYGNYKLQNEDWDHLALGDRARIIARARAVARRLGLDAHMSDEALYEALHEKRARRSPDSARLLAANRALHAALAAPPLIAGLQHVDLRRARARTPCGRPPSALSRAG